MSDNVTTIHEDRFPDTRHWFTSHELINRAGITYRQLDYWTRTGLLVTVDEIADPGSGYSRYYDLAQVRRARAISELLSIGMSLQLVRHHIDEFLDTGQISVGTLTITRNQEAS